MVCLGSVVGDGEEDETVVSFTLGGGAQCPDFAIFILFSVGDCHHARQGRGLSVFLGFLPLSLSSARW